MSDSGFIFVYQNLFYYRLNLVFLHIIDNKNVINYNKTGFKCHYQSFIVNKYINQISILEFRNDIIS